MRGVLKVNNKRDYMPDHQNRMNAGLLYQDFIVDLAYQQGLVIVQYSSEEYQKGIGESRTGAEIKYDGQFAKTGNVYIETAEKAWPRDGAYWPSGIYAHERTWLYIIGNFDTVFLFQKKILQLLHQAGRYPLKQIITSQGFIIPGNDAMKYAEVWHPDGAEKVKHLADNLAEKGKELHYLATMNPSQLTLFG